MRSARGLREREDCLGHGGSATAGSGRGDKLVQLCGPPHDEDMGREDGGGLGEDGERTGADDGGQRQEAPRITRGTSTHPVEPVRGRYGQ